MTKIAIQGGKPAVEGKIERYDPIHGDGIGPEFSAVEEIFYRYRPLSGYLGGERKGGYYVEKLEHDWCKAFGVKHAVACNSGTSGLLMACMAAGIKPRDHVLTTPYTMSATAAAPKFLGADIEFADIEMSTFCIDPEDVSRRIQPVTRAIIVTNLFGHPAQLQELKKHRAIIIEDNAQAPFASENEKLTGTIGDIGVFSLNVHKHFHAGEGGVCVTSNADLADAMRMARNHGEMANGSMVGLNLRMTEITAAIACIQLERGRELVAKREEIAQEIIELTRGNFYIWPPVTRRHCRHVFYCLPFIVDPKSIRLEGRHIQTTEQRDMILKALRAEGVPLQAGYVRPLYHLTAFRESFTHCPVAERAFKRVMLYENCAHDPTSAQIKQIGEAFHKVADYAQAQKTVATD